MYSGEAAASVYCSGVSGVGLPVSAATRQRRLSFQRSVTLPAQPSLPEDDEEEDEVSGSDEHSRLIRPSTVSHSATHLQAPTIRGDINGSPNSSHSSMDMERSDNEEAGPSTSGDLLDPRAHHSHHQQRHSAPAVTSGTPTKRTHFKQRSVSVYNTTDARVNEPKRNSKAKLGRTPSTPSVLLTKVKERIQEKLFQTSTEWPHAAAIVQERRQRAVESYEARISRQKSGEVEMEAIPMKELHSGSGHSGKRKRGRMRSDPIPAVLATTSTADTKDICPQCDSPQASTSTKSDPEAARQAFRRRSISEDTYDRPLQTHPAASAAYRHSSDSGIICSSMDLKAMKNEHIKRRSPKPSNSDLRTLSVDIAGGDSQLSISSVSSGYSGRSGASCGKYDIAEDTPCLIEEPPPSPPPPQEQPTTAPKPSRMVGDGGRNVTLQSSSLLYGSLDESTPSTSEDQKPIPEIVFDAQGQTWDVYGAEFDPEVLGEAIQQHLLKLMLSRTDSHDTAEGEESEEDHSSQCQSMPQCRNNRARGDSRKASDGSNFFYRLLCLFSGGQEAEATS